MSTISQILNMAVVKHGDRTISYKWRTASTTKEVNGSGDLWGEQITLSMSHDKDRKQFYAHLRHSYWQESRGFLCEQFALFGGENPAILVSREPVARYSQKAFDSFIAKTIAYLDANPNALTELAEQYLTVSV